MLLKFGVLNIEKRRVHLPEDESWGNTDQESPGEARVHGVSPVQEAPRVRDTGIRVSGKRTLSRGVEATREGTLQNVNFDTSFQTGERKLSVNQMNFFEQGKENAMIPEGTISGDDVHYWSEEDRKMAWMREKRITLFMQMELDNCRNELVCLIRCHNCAAESCPEREYSPMPLPISPHYIDSLQKRLFKAMKGIYILLPPTLKMVLNTYYPLPARQAPVHPQQQRISSCPPSPMPCTKPDSLRDDQTKISSFEAQEDGREEEQVEASLEVQSDDLTGKHRDGERNLLE